MSEEELRELAYAIDDLRNDVVLEYGKYSEEINAKIRNLSFQERVRLSRNYSAQFGTRLSDPGGMFETRFIVIDENPMGKSVKPLVCIVTPTLPFAQIEVIDILESVSKNSTAIGHPAIAYAIHHWQKLLAWSNYSKQLCVTTRTEDETVVIEPSTAQKLKNAKIYLKKVGQALAVIHKSVAVEPAKALESWIEQIGLYEKNTYLRVAWERLDLRYLNDFHDKKERIKNIEEYLYKLDQILNESYVSDSHELPVEFSKYRFLRSEITISQVVIFLNTDEVSKYVESGESADSPRCQWKVFANAFGKWYFNMKSFKHYRYTSKSMPPAGNPYVPNFFGRSTVTTFGDFFCHTSSISLVRKCEPFMCDHLQLATSELIELINQRLTK